MKCNVRENEEFLSIATIGIHIDQCVVNGNSLIWFPLSREEAKDQVFYIIAWVKEQKILYFQETYSVTAQRSLYVPPGQH